MSHMKMKYCNWKRDVTEILHLNKWDETEVKLLTMMSIKVKYCICNQNDVHERELLEMMMKYYLK